MPSNKIAVEGAKNVARPKKKVDIIRKLRKLCPSDTRELSPSEIRARRGYISCIICLGVILIVPIVTSTVFSLFKPNGDCWTTSESNIGFREKPDDETAYNYV